MKSLYRSVLTAPKTHPWYVQTRVERWDTNIPILSVVIPCYNHGQYIRETLQSLASQTFKDFETIVVDDGSDEQLTSNILEELQNAGIKVLRQEKSNVATALNLGIRAGRGRYVCCIGADDIVNPTYFEKCLSLLESNLGVAFVYSLVKTFGDEDRIWFTEPFDLRVLLEYNYICAAAMFRKTAWEEVGGFDQRMDGYEDWDFWLRVGKAGFRGELISETLFNYRRHGTTLNLRSDRKYKKLIDHIRANHDDLYSHLERITEIQRGYHDIRVPEPFLNLSSKAQYVSTGEAGGVILVNSQDTQIPQPFLREIAIKTKSKDAINLVLVATHRISFERNISTFGASNQAYYLERFLDPYCWLDFVVNLIRTRSARYVLISNPILTSEWASAISTRTTASVVNLVQDQPELLHLSAKYDEFISLHIVFSEHALRALIDDFGVSSEKIRSVSNMQSSDTLHELSKVLASHGKK
jgi:glycosyltransferase involved in cell wall biosynthesis